MSAIVNEKLWGVFFIIGSIAISLMVPSVGLWLGLSLIIVGIVLRYFGNAEPLFLRYLFLAGILSLITTAMVVLAFANWFTTAA